jgi:hypothetical protein
MKFSYTALTKDNKKITGVFDVADEDAAKAQLHKMGVAIITLKEISDEEYAAFEKKEKVEKKEKGIITYNFVALDPNSKEVEGTIDALDDFAAFRRLRLEYKFTVKNLFPVGATEAQIKEKLAALPQMETRLEQEEAIAKEEAEEAPVRGEKEGVEEAEERLNKEVIAEIDKVIINTKKAVEEHNDIFSTDLLREIDEKLGELERIRTSNNIKHITEVSNDLYALVSNPDKLEGKAEDKTYESLMDEMEDSALVRREFELYKKAIEASGIKKIFKKISTQIKKLTETTDEEKAKAGFFTKLKDKIHAKLDSISKKRAKKEAMKMKTKKKKGKLGKVAEKLSAYLKAKSPVLRRTRKREFIKALKELFGKKEVLKKVALAPGKPEEKVVAEVKKVRKKADFTSLFTEIDSFLAWLLCFYIIYFFLASFSLEKGIGLKPEFILKTLTSPLLLNITIFLLLMHFTLRIRNLHFRHHFFASLFLMIISLGIYLLLIVNF